MRRGAIIAAAMAAALGASSVQAETFTSAQFLEWPRKSQSSYFRTSIGMAGFIVSMRDKPKARCLENWYFSDAAAAEDTILATMRRFPEFHPRGVIVAVLQKQCGPLGPDGG